MFKKIFMRCDNKAKSKKILAVSNKNFLSKRKFLKGFSLLELLTVVAIISILSVLFFAGYRSGDKTFRLQRAANKLASDIRRAEELAMSGKDSRSSCNGATSSGYGIWADQDSASSSYKLYADTAASIFAPFVGPGWNSLGIPDCVIETVNLEKGVVIKAISPPVLFIFDVASINFQPPDPRITIDWFNPTSSVIITLGLQSDPTKTKRVIVNNSGLIDID